MKQKLSNNCRVLVQRLKDCDVEEVCRNPSLIIKYYPIQDPDNEATIFDEVYGLVNESLLTKTYRFRVFYFLNTFLSSTKVPAYVIAAYMKRLSRLTLIAKYKTLVTILKVVKNLLVRHPILLVLRDRVDEKARELELKSGTCTLRNWLESDPFITSETSDLKNTKAMDSCLWEIMPLRFHSHPKIAETSSFIGEPNGPQEESDLEDYVR